MLYCNTEIDFANPLGTLRDGSCRPHLDGAAHKVHTIGTYFVDFRF